MFSSLFVFAASALVTDVAAMAPTEVQSADSQLLSDHDATSEFFFTLAAFSLAGILIHIIKQRKLVKPKKVSLTLASPKDCGKPRCESPTNAKPRASPSGSPLSAQERNSRKTTDSLATAVRVGRAAQLPALIDAARERAIANGVNAAELSNLTSQLVLSSLRSCAAKRAFPEALKAYDHVAVHVEGCSTFNVGGWSLLLYTAIECGEFTRCERLIRKLLDGDVGIDDKDFMNIVRYYVHENDVSGLKALLLKLRAKGFVPDVISRNRALAGCVAQNAFTMADLLLDTNICGAKMDTIAYNTLMKGCAQAGHISRCLDLYAEMQEKGLTPSHVTYGILLDASIGGVDIERVKVLFADIIKAGVKLNVIHYTTFIKGLVGAGYLKDALQVLEEMLKSEDTQPDLVTYSTLVKALAEKGDVHESMRVLERMLAAGIMPDAIVFNIVLTACCVKPMETSYVLSVFDRLRRNGLTTTPATVSILVKALCSTLSFRECLDLLSEGPERLGSAVEQRHYTQLAQRCAREHMYAMSLEIYVAMARAAVKHDFLIKEESNTRMLRLCDDSAVPGGGQYAKAATVLHNAIAQGGGRMQAGALDSVLRSLHLA